MSLLNFILFVCFINSSIISIFGQIPRTFNSNGLFVPFIKKDTTRYMPILENREPFEKYTFTAKQVTIDKLKSNIIDQVPLLMLGQISSGKPSNVLDANNIKDIYNFRLLSLVDNRRLEFSNQPYLVLEMRPSNPIARSYKDLYAYWAHQGRYVDIPIHPKDGQPEYLFTPPFSGCSLVVDLIDEHHYRVYHVQGGHEDSEYNLLMDHGRGMVTSMQFEHYGLHSNVLTRERVVNSLGTAFMLYSQQLKKWTIYHQNVYIKGVLATPEVNSIRDVGENHVVEISLPPSRKIEVPKSTLLSIIDKDPIKEYTHRVKVNDMIAEVHTLGREKSNKFICRGN